MSGHQFPLVAAGSQHITQHKERETDMVEGSTVTTREVEAHTVEVFHDGHREVFEVCERHDGSWMVVCTTHESEELIARTFPGPRVPAWHVGELVGLPLVDEFADKIAAALTEAMGGAK